MSQKMLPEILIGVVLAGIFAATMSTADSQILSCSAAITRDILPKERDTLFITKAATAVVTIIALQISIFGGNNVFDLVIIAWSILGAAFGPLLFIYATNCKVSEFTGITMIVIALIVTIGWRQMGLGGSMYEIAPGMISSFIAYFILSRTKLNSIKSKS
jgi:sodium/proline symporter